MLGDLRSQRVPRPSTAPTPDSHYHQDEHHIHNQASDFGIAPERHATALDLLHPEASKRNEQKCQPSSGGDPGQRDDNPQPSLIS